GLGLAQQSGGDVDAVAQHITLAEEYVAQVNADAMMQGRFRRPPLSSFGERLLDLERAADGGLGAVEGGQAAVAGVLEHLAAEFVADAGDQLQVALHEQERELLVLLDQPAEADDVGKDDR